jgi:CHAD domain-containing protein
MTRSWAGTTKVTVEEDQLVPSGREVEVKLTAPAKVSAGQLRDALAGTRGVGRVGDATVIDLDATYYDTAGLGLAEQLVTLRRRTGGNDAGWHLKLPGAGFRTEISEPLTDDETPPAALAILVSVYARGHELVPVARVRTTRTAFEVFDAAGGRVAEVADDDVHSQSFGSATQLSAWREVEIELKDDGSEETLHVLTKSMLRAGARLSDDTSKLRRALGTRLSDPDTSTPGRPGRKPVEQSGAEIVSRYLSSQLAALLQADPAVRADLPDAVHAARVAIRRLRSALRVFGSVLAVEPPSDLDDRVSALSAVLGGARDAEVQQARLAKAIEALPSELVLGPVAARVLERALPDAIEARRVMLETLQGADYYQLIDDLLSYTGAISRSVATPKRGRSAATELLHPILKARRQLGDRAELAARTHNDLALHRARKAAKRLRYVAEAVQPVYGTKATKLAKQAEQVQEILGEHQDSVVMRARLRTLAGSTQGAANESAFTFGLLYGLELTKAEQSLREFEAIWMRISAKSW